ncbi:MAG: Tol-Pal system beta propeller repeat protein TolB [Endozoicomonas sp. (ex Botrylloides leachii)]|nr:Tol-Pal system beta propeller repeat protein TolB [Endozoicomonas sp. (ex Botrylloides leachii)]
MINSCERISSLESIRKVYAYASNHQLLSLCRVVTGFMLLTLFLFAHLAQADLLLTVTHGNDKLPKIAVSPFGWSGNQLLPEDMAAIISNDLELSGSFKILPQSKMLNLPSKPSEVSLRNWSILGVPYLVTGQVEKFGNGYNVSYQLFDTENEKKEILSGKLRGGAGELRALAHRVSDAVYEKITSFKGDFSSRLLYVTADMVKPAHQIIKDGRKRMVPPQYIYRLKYADADGHRARTIFQSNQPLLSPCWAPDGKRVAYVSFETGRSTIFIQDLASGKRRQIADYKGVNSSPAWSPDGKKIAFTLSKDGQPNIYILDLTTNRLSRVTSHFAIDTEPDWMPDGNSIVFTSNQGNSPQIYQLALTFKANGQIVPDGVAKRLTFDGIFNARASVFPNGKLIAMVHKGKGEEAFNIAVENLDTGKMRLLTESKLDDSPSVSPSGQRLVYSTQGKKHGELGVVSVNSGAKYRLPSESGDVREPAWGPGVQLERITAS